MLVFNTIKRKTRTPAFHMIDPHCGFPMELQTVLDKQESDEVNPKGMQTQIFRPCVSNAGRAIWNTRQ